MSKSELFESMARICNPHYQEQEVEELPDFEELWKRLCKAVKKASTS